MGLLIISLFGFLGGERRRRRWKKRRRKGGGWGGEQRGEGMGKGKEMKLVIYNLIFTINVYFWLCWVFVTVRAFL